MIGSLFSGYGGLDMAAEALGFGPTAWHCEIEAAPAKVLAHRWPGVPNLGDITKVDWTRVAPVDVITGGFPCQDISNAGKRAGMAGARSGLWSHYADAVRVLRPRLVLVENVGALLGRGMGRVLGDLAALGYDARWVSVRASDAGAPHGRQRIFIIAADAASEPWRVGDGDDVRARSGADGRRSPAGRGAPQNADVAAGGERRLAAPGQAEGRRSRADARGRGGAPTPDAERIASGQRRRTDVLGGRTLDAEQAGVGGVDAAPDTASGGLGTRVDDDVPGRGEPDAPGRGAAGEDAADAARWGPYAAAITRWEHITGRRAPRPTEPGPRGGERLSPAFVEWMMGLPAGWVCDVPGLTRNEMLRMLGNGVVPQQAVMAFTALLREEVAA